MKKIISGIGVTFMVIGGLRTIALLYTAVFSTTYNRQEMDISLYISVGGALIGLMIYNIVNKEPREGK